MAHPAGIAVEILGTEEASNGRSCEEHEVCGQQLDLDCVVRLRRVQIVDEDDEVEESAIAACWVTDGIDRCRVGFLSRHTVPHWKQCDGKLVQAIDIHSKGDESPTKRRKFHRNRGCCKAVIIDTARDDNTEKKKPADVSCGSSKRQKAQEQACLTHLHMAQMSVSSSIGGAGSIHPTGRVGTVGGNHV